MSKFLTKKAFDEIQECHCGKHPFKFHNSSQNIFIAKCNFTNDEFDIKTKQWNTSKKQACDFYCEYHGSRPIFKEITKAIVNSVKIPDKDIALEQKLKLLFRFVFVSNHVATLDEINILVKNKLKREPRKIYCYPSIGHMRISHYETLEDYRDRIFSKKIVDLSEPLLKQKENNPKRKVKKKSFISRFVLVSDEGDKEPEEIFPKNSVVQPLKENDLKIKEKKIPFSSKFIVVSEDGQSDEEPEDESDRDSESERELSDYDDKEVEESVIAEEVFSEEENFDDYDDASDYGDYD